MIVIWLVQTREKAITDGVKGAYTYLKDCMEPADKYIKHIKSSKLTQSTKINAEYHLYQLMELYVTCRIISYYLCLKTKNEKIDFFYHLVDIDYLRSICSYSDSYCSHFEYKTFSDSMKNRIEELFEENLSDTKKAFQECVDKFHIQIYENRLTKEDAIVGMLSFYINQGVWTALRILPTSLCRFEKVIFQGNAIFNFDYISKRLFTFNHKFELEPIFDNLRFYNESGRDCFLYLLELAKKLYNSEPEVKLDKVERDMELVKRHCEKNTESINNLQVCFYEHINKANHNNKLVYYQTLSQEELITEFYEFHKIPKNFLDILQTYRFEGNIILNEKFQIREGYQALVITYLDGCVVSKKNMALLRVLFHIEAKNPATAKNGYVERLKNFKNFIKNYAI